MQIIYLTRVTLRVLVLLRILLANRLLHHKMVITYIFDMNYNPYLYNDLIFEVVLSTSRDDVRSIHWIKFLKIVYNQT